MFRSTFRSSPRTYKIHHSASHGQIEYVRLMLVYLNQKFENIPVHGDDRNTAKNRVSMGQLPILEIDNGTIICQSTTIGRYISKEYGLAGTGNIEIAKADMIVDSIVDVWSPLKLVYQDQQKGDIQLMIQSWARFYDQHLKPFLESCHRILQSNNTGWLVGNKVTWADFALAEFLSVLHVHFTAEGLDSFPDLVSYMERIFALPNVKEYVAKRKRIPF